MKDKVALQARRDLKRNKIIDNCCKAFAKTGIEGTSITTLCETAKVNPKVMYDYFECKEDIIMACAIKSVDNVYARVAKHVLSNGDLFEDIEKMIAECYAARAEIRFLYQVLLSPNYMKKLKGVIREKQEKYFEFKQIIAKDLNQKFEDVDALFNIMIGVIDYYCLTEDERYITVCKNYIYKFIKELIGE